MSIKKSFVTLHTALLAYDQEATIADLMADAKIIKIMTASKGGFSGEDSFVTVDGNKVARICAMTGAVFAHDNSNKETSFFYKNGSYMIGAEIVKANARKAWELDREDREQELEDDMLDGNIKPKDWKEAVKAIQAETFEWELDEDVKAELIADYDGYPTKEAFTEAYNAGEVPNFTDYAETTEALRALAPKREEAEDEAEEEA